MHAFVSRLHVVLPCRKRNLRSFPAGIATGWVWSVAQSAQAAAEGTVHYAQMALSPLAALRSPRGAGAGTTGKKAASASGRKAQPTPQATPGQQTPGGGRAPSALGGFGTPVSGDPEPDKARPALFFHSSKSSDRTRLYFSRAE